MTSAPPELKIGMDANHVKLKCPYCRSTNLRNSRIRSGMDFLYLLLLHHPIRCRTCDYRFMRWLWMSASSSERVL